MHACPGSDDEHGPSSPLQSTGLKGSISTFGISPCQFLACFILQEYGIIGVNKETWSLLDKQGSIALRVRQLEIHYQLSDSLHIAVGE